MKERQTYFCQTCGYETLQRLGRCPDCGSFGTIKPKETVPIDKKRRKNKKKVKTYKLKDIKGESQKRVSTQITELDRVLGGGIVPGSLVLIGGDPGIGKSTLLLDMADNIAVKNGKVLYVSGEESLSQLSIRAKRMNKESDNLLFLTETNIESIVDTIEDLEPELVIIDSIQTMSISDATSTPGSVSQVRGVTNYLLDKIKPLNIPVFLVGHVTKDGNLAGPRVLEHMVDTVLYFEGDRSRNTRLLRAVKNRFGATNEIGLFEMEDSGLKEVTNASALLLEERPTEGCGSIVIPVLEGQRVLLLELQGLVSGGNGQIPRRMATGLDTNRMLLVMAIMEKRLGLSFHDLDCYLNIVGGIKSDEPALDLAIVFALYSSLKEFELPSDLICFGEVGLTGEVRSIPDVVNRVKEAQRLGFKSCILPKSAMKSFKNNRPDINFYPVENISQAIGALKSMINKKIM